MNDIHGREGTSLGGQFSTEVWRLLQAGVALGSLYSLVAHVVNMTYLLVSGSAQGMTLREIAAAQPLWPSLIRIGIRLPYPIIEVILVCIVLAVITYILVRYVCELVWVQERVQITLCWARVKWYNPFSWVVAILCTIVEMVKWVLKLICRWIVVIVVVLVVICFVVTVIIIF